MKIMTRKTLTLTNAEQTNFQNTIDILNKILIELKDDDLTGYGYEDNPISAEEISETLDLIQCLIESSSNEE